MTRMIFHVGPVSALSELFELHRRRTWPQYRMLVTIRPVFAHIIAVHITNLVSFTILTQDSRHKFTRCPVQSLGTLISRTPLHQSFRDLHRTVECLLVILRHDNATVEPPATLRSRIRPREVNTLPKDTDVFTIDIVRRHLLRGQFPKDVFQLFD